MQNVFKKFIRDLIKYSDSDVHLSVTINSTDLLIDGIVSLEFSDFDFCNRDNSIYINGGDNQVRLCIDKIAKTIYYKEEQMYLFISPGLKLTVAFC